MLIAVLQEHQLAYLAGLVDGEGSLECQKAMQAGGVTPQYISRLAFCFASPEPLATLSGWLGLPVRTAPATTANRSPCYRMAIKKGMLIPLLEGMLPFLILKKRQAELILEIEHIRLAHSPSRRLPRGKQRRMPEHAVDEMNRLWLQLRSLKSNKRRMDARVNLAA